MKKKYILYPMVIVLILILIFMLSYIFAGLRLKLKDVYVASVSLPQRSEIKEEFLKKIRIPDEYIDENVLVDKDEIIGKYVKLNAYIPSGSLFYKDILDEKEKMKDAAHTELTKGQVTYDLFIKNISANPANLIEGINVDIYLTINKKDVISDLLISNAKIIGLYDKNNKRIKDYDFDASLNIVSIAVGKDMVPYLNKAIVLGDVNLIVGSNLYDDKKPKLNTDSELFTYLK